MCIWRVYYFTRPLFTVLYSWKAKCASFPLNPLWCPETKEKLRNFLSSLVSLHVTRIFPIWGNPISHLKELIGEWTRLNSNRMVWVGRYIKDHLIPNLPPWAGTPLSRLDSWKSHPTWPWTFSGMGHAQFPWTACSSASSPSRGRTEVTSSSLHGHVSPWIISFLNQRFLKVSDTQTSMSTSGKQDDLILLCSICLLMWFSCPSLQCHCICYRCCMLCKLGVYWKKKKEIFKR